MKRLKIAFFSAYIVAVFVSFAVAQAGNEGPGGAQPITGCPSPAPSALPSGTPSGTPSPVVSSLPGCGLAPLGAVLAEYRTFGGYVPQPDLVSGVRIHEAGEVVAFAGDRIRPIGQLSMQTLEFVAAEARDAVASQLVDSDPDSPECTDAPIRSYLLVRPEGEQVEIARFVSNCHRYYPVGGRHIGIEQLLDALKP